MAPASIYNDCCIYVVHTVCSNKKYVSIPSSYYLPEHCVKLTVVTCRYTLYFSVYWQSMLLYGFRWIRTSAARYVTWRVRTNQRWTRITSYVPYRAEHVCVRRLRQALHDDAVAATSRGVVESRKFIHVCTKCEKFCNSRLLCRKCHKKKKQNKKSK